MIWGAKKQVLGSIEIRIPKQRKERKVTLIIRKTRTPSVGWEKEASWLVWDPCWLLVRRKCFKYKYAWGLSRASSLGFGDLALSPFDRMALQNLKVKATRMPKHDLWDQTSKSWPRAISNHGGGRRGRFLLLTDLRSCTRKHWQKYSKTTELQSTTNSMAAQRGIWTSQDPGTVRSPGVRDQDLRLGGT